MSTFPRYDDASTPCGAPEWAQRRRRKGGRLRHKCVVGKNCYLSSAEQLLPSGRISAETGVLEEESGLPIGLPACHGHQTTERGGRNWSLTLPGARKNGAPHCSYAALTNTPSPTRCEKNFPDNSGYNKECSTRARGTAKDAIPKQPARRHRRSNERIAGTIARRLVRPGTGRTGNARTCTAGRKHVPQYSHAVSTSLVDTTALTKRTEATQRAQPKRTLKTRKGKTPKGEEAPRSQVQGRMWIRWLFFCHLYMLLREWRPKSETLFADIVKLTICRARALPWATCS